MNRLKELRHRYDLRLRKLEEYVNIDHSRLSIIEKHDTHIRADTLYRLTNFFACTSDYFLGNSEIGVFVQYGDKATDVMCITDSELDYYKDIGDCDEIRLIGEVIAKSRRKRN